MLFRSETFANKDKEEKFIVKQEENKTTSTPEVHQNEQKFTDTPPEVHQINQTNQTIQKFTNTPPKVSETKQNFANQSVEDEEEDDYEAFSNFNYARY